jgi:hypothetical protein
MSAPISSLTTIAKTSISTTHYLPLADGTSANYKLLIQDLFPVGNTLGAASESIYVNVTNKNTLNFKGIKSLSALISVATVSNNIELDFDPSNLDLSACDNSTSQFLSGNVDLTSTVTGILPVANGGTGLATLTANSLFVGNGTSALTALGVATNGQIPIGRTGLSPVLANITAGTNVTVTNGSGSITIAASLTTLTANLDGAGYNIYGLGWLSGDGQNEGIAINSAGKVFIGSSTPTAFYNYDLNINNGLGFNGSIIQRLEMSSSSSPAYLGIYGAAASVSNVAGGGLVMEGGAASGTGAGGGVTISGGDAAGSGTGGNITIDPGTSGSGTGGKTIINATGTAGPLVNFGGSTGIASANSVSSSTASAAAKTGAIRIQINGVDAWIRVYATAE